MKIPSPWPNHPHTRFNVNNGECQGTFGVGLEMDLPDDTVEVLLEAVEADKDDAKLVAQPLIWSKEFGMVDAKDHLKKVEIKKEEAKLKERQEIERTRRQDEAKAAKVKSVKERTDKMYKDVPEGMLVDPVTGANVPRKDEPKEKIKVNRTASGMAKVTKEPKPKK